MKNPSGIIFGVLVGIAATLLLTLNLWGHEWYKTMTAIVVGVLIGLFIVNPKETWVMIKRSFIVFKLPRKNLGIKQKEIVVQSVGIIISSLFYLLLFCIPLLITRALTTLAAGHYQEVGVPDLIMFVITIFFLVSVGITIGLSISSFIVSEWKASNVYKVWGEKYQSEGIPTLISQNILDNGQLYTIKKYVFSAILDFITTFAKGFKSFLKGMSALILAILLIFLISLPLAIVCFIKNITKHGWSLVTSTSIVIGGLIGTIFESYVLGFGFGIVSLMAFYLAYILPEKMSDIRYASFIFDDNALFEKMAKKLGLI